MREGHTKVVKALRERGGELKWDEGQESGELCELARAGDLEKVRLLLMCGVNADAADYDKRTCLHLAASVGNLRVVTALVEHDCDVNFQDRYQVTPPQAQVLADSCLRCFSYQAHFMPPPFLKEFWFQHEPE